MLFKSYLSILGLILLLLISPCKVRNSIQQVLDIPLTNVLNKSISNIQESHCSIYAQATHTIVAKKKRTPLLTTYHSSTVLNFACKIKKPSVQRFISAAHFEVIPYYILYRNFKFHL